MPSPLPLPTRTTAQPLRRAHQWICASCQTRVALQPQSQVRAFATSRQRRASGHSRRTALPDKPARTRFAPSPTGNLHLGSIRTALFNYLLARRTGGQFLLRIEDTDQKRTVPGAEQRLFHDLRWAGLQWDEGPLVGGPYGPYRQSERLFLYNTHIENLLRDRKAYRCFCSTERIDELNRIRHEKGLPLGYDRRCSDIPVEQAEDRAQKGESHVIRFHVPKEYPKYNDLVYGKTGHGDTKSKQHQFDEPVFDDPILMKSDGFPTYHFANVVDDKLMQITHVVRGSEWMSSTPLHIALYDAFGWSPPEFAHVPLLVDKNKQKLSKRNFDSDISSFRDKMGVFPETLTNFAALLGWSHQQKSDVMTLQDLEQLFDLKITKGNTIVAFEKLDFLQEQHAREKVNKGGDAFEQIIRDVAVAVLEAYGAKSVTNFIGKRKLRDVIASMLQTQSLPYRNPAQFAQSIDVFLSDSASKSTPSLSTVLADPTLLSNLRIAASTLLLTPPESWTREVHRNNLNMLTFTSSSNPSVSETKAAKKDLYAFLRWALLGGQRGPAIPDTMEILGREMCEQRIRKAVMAAKEVENQSSKPDLKENKIREREWQAHKFAAAATVAVQS